MGLVDALIGLKKSREQWAMEGPMREASIAKLQAEAAKAQSDQKMKDQWAKIFDGFIKKQFPDGLPQPQQPPAGGQQPPGLSDMMTRFSSSFPSASTGDRAGSSNEGRGVMPAGDISQMLGMQPAQAAPQGPRQGQPQAQGPGPLANMTPQQAMMMDVMATQGGMTGFDAAGMIRNRTAIRAQDRLDRRGDQLHGEAEARLKQSDEHFNRTFGRSGTEYKTQSITLPGGATGFMVIPKFLAGGQGQGSGLGSVGNVIQTSPTKKELPIAEANIPLWIHPDTLESAPVGATANQAAKQGFVRVTTNTHSKVNDFRAVSVLVDQIDNLMKDVFPSEESALGRVPGAIERSGGAVLQTNVQAALLKSLMDGTQAALVRMFEKGTLTDKDIARAKKLNVSLTDRADVAWAKIANMKVFISNLQKGFLKGTAKKQPENDLSGMSDKELLKQLEAK